MSQRRYLNCVNGAPGAGVVSLFMIARLGFIEKEGAALLTTFPPSVLSDSYVPGPGALLMSIAALFPEPMPHLGRTSIVWAKPGV